MQARWKGRIVPAIGLLLLLTLPVWAMGSSQPTPDPQEQAASQQASDASAPSKEPDGESFWVRTLDDPVVLFTGVLAVTTVLLAVIATVQIGFLIRADGVTRIAAAAAQRSADAAVNIELPILRAYGDPELLHMDGPMPAEGAYGGSVIDRVPERFSAVPAADFWNAGRTVAIVTDVNIGWCVDKTLPTVATYAATRSFPGGIPVPPGDRKEATRSLDMPVHTISLTEVETASVRAGETTFWFFIRLRYADFMGESHGVGFCWEWYIQPGGGAESFIARKADAPETYTKRT